MLSKNNSRFFKKRYFHENHLSPCQTKLESEMNIINHSAKCKNLQREHQMLIRLNHPNIVKCDIQFYQNFERCCIRLEQAECDFLEYLSHFFLNRTRAFFRTQISLLRNIAEAINYLHGLDFVHNDIKLENCLLFVKTKTVSIHQTQKQKTQNIEQSNTKNNNSHHIQMTSSSLSQISSKQQPSNEKQSPIISQSSSLDTTQSNGRKDSNPINNNPQEKKNAKGKLILKLADFEFSCAANQCNTLEYFKTWRLRNRKYMSPELIELSNQLDMTSQRLNQESNSLSLSLLQTQFKRACSLYCEEPILSGLSTNAEEDSSDCPSTLSTELTVGSNSLKSVLSQTQQDLILQNAVKSVNMKSNDIFCFGILVFSAIFGVYPFEIQPTKSDSLYSLICEERWNEFWQLFDHRIQTMISQGFLVEQVKILKDLLEKLLSSNPLLRLDSSAILQHPFFSNSSENK